LAGANKKEILKFYQKILDII